MKRLIVAIAAATAAVLFAAGLRGGRGSSGSVPCTAATGSAHGIGLGWAEHAFAD